MNNFAGDIRYDQAAGLRKMVGKSFESPKPFDKEPEYELQSSEEKIKNTKIITITSGKGGVGKTSMSVNLGLALASQNKKVLLFDADLGLANINVVLGVVPKYNLYHVIKGHKKLKDIIIQTPEGLDIIAGASGYSSLANLSEKERNKIVVEVDQLKEYDYLLIDTGAGVSSNVIGFTLPADEILVITTPEPTSITDAYGIIKSIVLEASDKCIKLLVNRAATSLEGRKVAERVVNISNQFLNVKVENCGFIYDDEMVPKSIRKQKPFYSLYPKSKASSCLNVIAARLMGDKNGFDKKNVGIGAFFRKILKTN